MNADFKREFERAQILFCGILVLNKRKRYSGVHQLALDAHQLMNEVRNSDNADEATSTRADKLQKCAVIIITARTTIDRVDACVKALKVLEIAE